MMPLVSHRLPSTYQAMDTLGSNTTWGALAQGHVQSCPPPSYVNTHNEQMGFNWKVFLSEWKSFQQGCIPVGYILPACWPYPSMHCGGCLPRGCLSRWCLPRGDVADTPLWTEWQTGVKTLSCHSFVAGGNKMFKIKRFKINSSTIVVQSYSLVVMY